MENKDKLLKDLLIELTKEFEVQFKEDTGNIIERALTDGAVSYFLEENLIESFVRQVGDTLKDPSKVQPNIEFLERIKKEKRIDTNIFGVVEYEKFTSLIPFFQITSGEVLYFRKFVFKEGLEDINHYLISWNGISYMAVYDERIKRFALNEDDFRDRKYNNMLSLGSVKVIGKLEKIEKI